MADEIGTYYFQLAPSTEGIGKSISEALGDTGSKASKSFGQSFGRGLATVGKIAAGAIASAKAGVVAVTKEVVSEYAEYEQLVGGVETLFGTQGMGLEEYAKSIGKTASQAVQEYDALNKAQTEVMNNAAEAYKTAGLSANDYMETVTGFAASLKQSTANELEAAQVADMAVIDMADNANKMGTSMESIQNAYAGFAKQNYTMLDNLKLGYGGTKEEMQRLLADATALTGIEYDLDSLSDVYNAIHVIQTDLGITGTTAKEASSTISGSLGMLSSAWQNLVVGFANGEADLDALIDNLITSATTALDNLIPTIIRAMGGISESLVKIAPIIAEKLPELIEAVLPNLIQAAMNLVGGLVAALPSILQILTENLPTVVSSLIDITENLITTVLGMLPDMIKAVVTIITTILQKLSDMLPTLIPAIVEGVILVVNTLIENLPLLLEGILTLIKALAQGIIEALPILIDALPEIIIGIVDFILQAIPQIILAVVEIVMAIVRALPDIIMALVDALPEIIEGIIVAIVENLPMFIEAAVEIILGLVEALPTLIITLIEMLPQIIVSIVKALVEAAPQFVEAGKKLLSSLGEGFKNFLPRMLEIQKNIGETMMKFFRGLIDKVKEIGQNIMNGLSEGLKSKITAITDTVKNIGEKISEGFKSFFGIHSPSTLFAEYGQFIDEGLANGISDGRGVVTDAMDELNDSVVGDIQTSASVAYDSGYNRRSVETTSESKLYDLLATYLPYLAERSDVNISLEGNTNGLFNLIRRADSEFKKQTGQSAFA